MPLVDRALSGYEWVARIRGDKDALDAGFRREPATAESGHAKAGEAGSERFVVRGRKPGRVEIRLLQRRPWEGDEVAPLEEHDLTVTVV